jgi:hypothetical protein
MASVTLAESAKLSQNMLASGVIEDVITVNQMFNALPFQEIEGNALQYSRESVLGDAMVAGVGTQITADAAATFTTVTSSLTTIIGKASVNGLIQATRSNYSDQALVQIASKAKSVGRKYQDMLINGDSGTANEFDGLLSLVSGGQTVTSATDGSVLSFRALDDAIALCTAKDGMIDYIAMNSREINTLLDMYRALGGASINEVVTLPDGTVTNMPMYRGIPIYRNDWLPITQTQGASSVASSIVMGTFDDGSMSNGIAGLTAMGDAGMRVVQVGQAENYDEEVYHIKWYSSLANYSDKGLVAITGIVPA